MRVNRFLVPLMAGSVVSAPVNELEPKHQLEVRMNNPGMVAVGVVSACIACTVASVGVLTYKLAKKTFELTNDKYTVDMNAANQAMKLAQENHDASQEKDIIEAFKKAIDFSTEALDKNIKTIEKADPGNEFVKDYPKKVSDAKIAYIQGLAAGAMQFPTGKTSPAITASKTYCKALEELFKASTKKMKTLEDNSQSPSPANSRSPSPAAPRSGGSAVSPGISRTNSISISRGSSHGRGRSPSVVSSHSAGTQDLRLAEEGSIPLQRQGTAGRATATGSQLPNSPTLARRPTANSDRGLMRKPSNSKTDKGKAASLHRRMVRRVDFDVVWLESGFGSEAAAVSRYLSGRYYALSRIYANRPHKLPPVNASFVATPRVSGSGGHHAVLFADRIRNCEDGIVVPELGVAFLSCDPGRDGWNTVMGAFAENQDANPGGQIWLYRYSKDVVAADDDATMRLQRFGLSGFPEPKLFHPIGIAFDHPTETLFVLNNDVRGPRLEVFRYKPSIISPLLKHLGTIEHPLIYSPNSVEVVSSTELYITNDHRFPARYHPILSTLENYLLLAKGTVVRVKLSSKPSTIESIRTVASLPFANGIARLNASTMVVSSTNTASIHFYSIPATAAGEKKAGSKEEQLTLTSVVKLPFLPDNLSVDEKGKLLIAGHPSPPELNQVSRSRALCQDERVRSPKANEPKHCRKAMAPSWAAEWTEAGGLRDLYISRGAEAGGYGTTATAARDSATGVGFLTALYDEGILNERAIPLASSPEPSTCVLMTDSGSLYVTFYTLLLAYEGP
ncbi:hypothetical protein PspLS_10808, partial [Pyricularia sp. CBS 133598]